MLFVLTFGFPSNILPAILGGGEAARRCPRRGVAWPERRSAAPCCRGDICVFGLSCHITPAARAERPCWPPASRHEVAKGLDVSKSVRSPVRHSRQADAARLSHRQRR